MFFINSQLHSQTLNDYFSPTELKILVQVQSLIHNTHFEKAESLLANSKSNISESTYLFFLQVNYFWRYVYTKNDSFLTLTNKYGEKNKIFIESKQNTESLKNDFFLGATHGYLGLSKAMDNSLISAMKYGKKGYNELKKIYKKYPEFKETELGLGLYEGMISKLPTFLRWIVYPFGIKGDIDSALKHLDNASGSNMITKADAWFFEYGFLKEENNILKESILDSLVNTYSENPLYHFLKGRSLFKKNDYSRALIEFNLSKKFLDESFQNLNKDVFSHLAKCNYRLKNYQQCISNYLLVENYYKHLKKKSRLDELYSYVSKSYSALGDKRNSKKYYELINDKKVYNSI